MGDTGDRYTLSKKIDRQPRPSMAIASHNGLGDTPIDGRFFLFILFLILRRMGKNTA